MPEPLQLVPFGEDLGLLLLISLHPLEEDHLLPLVSAALFFWSPVIDESGNTQLDR